MQKLDKSYELTIITGEDAQSFSLKQQIGKKSCLLKEQDDFFTNSSFPHCWQQESCVSFSIEQDRNVFNTVNIFTYNVD